MRIRFAILVSILSYTTQAQVELNQIENDVHVYRELFSSAIQNGVACYRIPSIITAPNGDIIVAADQRIPSCADLRGNDDINIIIRRSSDNGNTWSEIETVVDYPLGQSASDPSMIVDKITGTIFLFFNFMDLHQEKDIYYLMVTQSIDNGRTWSKPVDITSQITKPEWHKDFKFITSGRGTQTSGGKLIHTLVNLQKGLYLFSSDNHGKDWYLIDTPIRPADESKIVELADGSWMINSRVNGEGFRYVHTSSDEGKSWISKPDTFLIDPGCNASIIRYSSIKEGADKNRLLFSNPKDKNQRKNMSVRISYDEGKSWSKGKTVDSGSSAYSSMTVLPDGSIGLVYEKDDYQKIAFVRFTLEWLTDGKDSYHKTEK